MFNFKQQENVYCTKNKLDGLPYSFWDIILHSLDTASVVRDKSNLKQDKHTQRGMCTREWIKVEFVLYTKQTTLKLVITKIFCVCWYSFLLPSPHMSNPFPPNLGPPLI